MTTPGWYPDPAGTPGMLRYWDGTAWTDRLQPATPAPSVTPAPVTPAEAPAPPGDTVSGPTASAPSAEPDVEPVVASPTAPHDAWGVAVPATESPYAVTRTDPRTLPPSVEPPSCWGPDPWDATGTRQRLYDGTEWTTKVFTPDEGVVDEAALLAQSAPGAVPGERSSRTPLYALLGMAAVIVVLVAGLMLRGHGTSPSTGSTPDSVVSADGPSSPCAVLPGARLTSLLNAAVPTSEAGWRLTKTTRTGTPPALADLGRVAADPRMQAQIATDRMTQMYMESLKDLAAFQEGASCQYRLTNPGRGSISLTIAYGAAQGRTLLQDGLNPGTAANFASLRRSSPADVQLPPLSDGQRSVPVGDDAAYAPGLRLEPNQPLAAVRVGESWASVYVSGRSKDAPAGSAASPAKEKAFWTAVLGTAARTLDAAPDPAEWATTTTSTTVRPTTTTLGTTHTTGQWHWDTRNPQSPQPVQPAPPGVLLFIFLALLAVFLLTVVLFVVITWRLLTKAGQKGWLALVPVMNLVVLLRVARLSVWLIVLSFLPVVNMVFYPVLFFKLAKEFGKSDGFAIGAALCFPIFGGILAFGRAEYAGPIEPLF